RNIMSTSIQAWLMREGSGTPARAGQARAVAAIRHGLRGPRWQPEITRGLRSAVRDRAHEASPQRPAGRPLEARQLSALAARAHAARVVRLVYPRRRNLACGGVASPARANGAGPDPSLRPRLLHRVPQPAACHRARFSVLPV